MGIFQQYPFFLNFTAVVLHIGTFLVLFVLLKKILFDPLLQTVHERRTTIEEGEEEIDTRREQLSERIRAFENRMEQEKQEATKQMQEIVSEGDDRRAEIVSEAHKEALQILENARDEVEREIEKTEDALRERTARVAADMAQQISGRDLEQDVLESRITDAS